MSVETLIALAREVGLDDCAVVPAARMDEDAAFMEHWLEHGWQGNMHYFEQHRELRYDPRQLVPGAQTIVVGILTYAHSGHDYHRTMKSKLFELQSRLQAYAREKGEALEISESQHVFCDSAPFLERAWAVKAGLGCIGKNHQFIHARLGSMVHLGELVLNTAIQAPLPTPYQADLCIDCNRCVEACPGGALGRAMWDARQCVAYVTHKCLVCQLVCPYNETDSRNENCTGV